LLLFIEHHQKQRLISHNLAVLSFVEPTAGYDFCGKRGAMADNLLQKTARAARRAMRHLTPSAGLPDLMEGSEH
jgi:hypothetical protein